MKTGNDEARDTNTSIEALRAWAKGSDAQKPEPISGEREAWVNTSELSRALRVAKEVKGAPLGRLPLILPR
jgi:hypothetical protein